MPTHAKSKLKLDTYSFSLLLRGADPLEHLDALFEAGCDDATFGEREGVHFANFDRRSSSALEAINSAIQAVESVSGLHVVRVEPEELVNASAIAERVGRTRESVRLLIAGRRGPGHFPRPASWLNYRTKLWRWPEVARWFASELGVSLEDHELAIAISSVNAALDQRKRDVPAGFENGEGSLGNVVPAAGAPLPRLAKNGGGAAAQGGFSFQNRVGAWLATCVLAESEMPPLWRLGAGTTLERLSCETDDSVDDISVEASDGHQIFVNAKAGFRLEEGPGSRFASVMDQFVRQYLQHIEPQRRTTRNPGLSEVRLMLAVDASSPGTVRRELADALTSTREGRSVSLPSRQDRALRTAEGHIRLAWKRHAGAEPSEGDVLDMLKSLWVQEFDLNQGEAREQQAQFLLANAILAEPARSAAAWAFLVEYASRLAQRRATADRRSLRRALEEVGFRLQASPSYRDDITTLTRYSKTTLDLLRERSEIRVGSHVVKVARPCLDALSVAAERGSTVVVGEPGAGKSGVLHDLGLALVDQGRDVVFIATDRLGAETLNDLDHEIGLHHTLVEVLQAWSGTSPAFLIIDALDAARSQLGAQMLVDLLALAEKSADRWHVIAAIRKFDLRHSRALQRIFRGTPPSDFHDPEFRALRHVNVPNLDLEEVSQVAAQSPELAAAIASAPTQLWHLVRVIYNLRLLAELVDDGVQVEDLATIRTQVDLLDRFWQARVLEPISTRDAREMVLQLAAEAMVAKRALAADRSTVVGHHATLGVHLTQLLSSHVLLNWQVSPTAAPDEYKLTFAHHVLFDYAVARLLLRDPGVVDKRLAAEPDLVLAIRPSLVFRAEIDWMADNTREQFWQMTLNRMGGQLPEIAKIVGPEVAARNAERLEDLNGLIAGLGGQDFVIRRCAQAALGHLIGSLLANSSGHPLSHERAQPWIDFVEILSRDLRPEVAFPVETLLRELARGAAGSPGDTAKLGAGARRLLEFNWSQPTPNLRLTITGLEASCRTYDSDPVETAKLIRRGLTREHLAARGAEELRWIADQVPVLLRQDASLVEDIYTAAFGYREESQEATTLLDSRIFSISSHRRQDYQMGLSRLAELFPRFLVEAPEAATRAVIAATEAYYAQSHQTDHEARQEFSFGDRIAAIRSDHSSIWDSTGNDEPRKLLLAFGRHLDQLAADPARRQQWQAIIDILVEKNSLAAVWRTVLQSAAKAPQTLGADVKPLAWALPILTKSDTRDLARSYIRAALPTFTREEKDRTEGAIRGVPDFLGAEQRETAEELRDLLLACLEHEPDQAEAPARRPRIGAGGAADDDGDSPGFLLTGWSPGYEDEEAHLRAAGIRTDTDEFKRLYAEVQTAREFAERFLNSTPEPLDIDAVLPHLRSLHHRLTSMAGTELSRLEQHLYPWGYLAEASERIARHPSLSCDSDDGTFIRAVLLDASQHPSPAALAGEQASFDEHPHWGSPSARISAARGLLLLARSTTCLKPDVLGAIERLAHDSVASVRLQVADRLLMLYETAPDLMWRLVDAFAATEPSNGVLQIYVHTVSKLAGPHRERVEALVKGVYDRVQAGPGAQRVRKGCLAIFVSLYLWDDRPEARKMLNTIATDPSAHSELASHLARQTRGFLTPGPALHPDPAQDESRIRAIGLLASVLGATASQIAAIRSQRSGQDFGNWPEEAQLRLRSLYDVADSIAQQLFFASGAFDEHQSGATGKQAALSLAEKQRFLQECGPLIDQLAELGVPRVAHQLIETLESLVEADPQSVFFRVASVIEAAESHGYQYEALAVERVVRLIERYMAEFRGLFQSSAEARNALIRTLDVFIRAGWPQAVRLTYRLDDVLK